MVLHSQQLVRDRPSIPLSAPGRRHTTLLTTTSSDAHTWNLVYLQLLLEELGSTVVNLGPCVPESLLIDSAESLNPDAIVVSTVNGHGVRDGLSLIRALRAVPSIRPTSVVIGGMLGISCDGGWGSRGGLR